MLIAYAMQWDLSEAGLVCRDLGFPGAVAATHGSKFGFTPATIWMDNLYCHGTEAKLHRCRCGCDSVAHGSHVCWRRFDGWGVHDCDRTEAAGGRCQQPATTSTTPAPTTRRPRVPLRQETG